MVGDLNDGNGPFLINYRDGHNEMNPGFINAVRVFQKIFGLTTIKDIPENSLEERKKWLKESLTTVFTALNPTFIYELDLKNVEKRNVSATIEELGGRMTIAVKNKSTKDDLFSFVFYAEPNRHSTVFDLETFATKAGLNFIESLKQHSNLIEPGTTQDLLWSLVKSPVLLVRNFKNILYRYLSDSIDDNSTKIRFLRYIGSSFISFQSSLSDLKKLSAFQTIVGNVLNEVSWDDENTLNDISETIFILEKIPELKDVVANNVRGIRTSDKSKLETIKTSFKNIEYLDLRNMFNVDVLDLANFTKLKRLNLTNSHFKTIDGLSANTYLEELTLKDTKNFVAIDVTGLDRLKIIYAERSSIENIVGLNTLKELETLHLGNTARFKHVDVSSSKNLHTLILDTSNVETLIGLDSLENLTELGLTHTKSLFIDEINLNFHPKLQNLFLRNSNVKSLENISNHQSVELIELEHTAIKTLDITNAKKLEYLALSNSNIEEIEGIDTVENLATVELEQAKNIKSLTVGPANKNLVLLLSGSGIIDKFQIKGFEYLNEAKVSW